MFIFYDISFGTFQRQIIREVDTIIYVSILVEKSAGIIIVEC